MVSTRLQPLPGQHQRGDAGRIARPPQQRPDETQWLGLNKHIGEAECDARQGVPGADGVDCLAGDAGLHRQEDASNEEWEPLNSVGMRGLLSLQPVQRRPAQLARLHGGLAVFAQILAGRDIVVKSVTHLTAPGAHEGIGEDEVGDKVARRVVGGLLAGCGTEAEGGQNGRHIVELVVVLS